MDNRNLALERVTLIVCVSTAFLVPFIASAINLSLPSMGEEYGSSALLLSWVVTSYLLASAAFLLPFGRLADIIGRRKVFLIGLSLFAFFSLLCGWAGSVELLIFLRFMQGVSSAMIFGTSTAILTSVYPPDRRGKVLGISVASTYIGLSLGPVLGGWLNHNLGWRSIFYFIAILSFVISIYAFRHLKGEWKGAAGEKFDLSGSILYIAGLAAFLYGMSSLSTSIWTWLVVGGGVSLLAVFVGYEMRQVHPLIEIKLFVRNMSFSLSNLAAMLHYSATFALTFLMSIYLQIIVGYSSQTAGLVILAQPLMMALFSPLAGSLSDRKPPWKVASVGMALTALGIFSFAFLGQETAISLVVANLVLIGFGFALFSSPNTNAVMSSVQPRLYGIASSALGTMRLTGQAFSMAIVTLIMAVYIGSAAFSVVEAETLLTSIRVAFFVFSLICCLGIVVSAYRGKGSEESAKSAG